jgi:hypothetical protein
MVLAPLEHRPPAAVRKKLCTRPAAFDEEGCDSIQTVSSWNFLFVREARSLIGRATLTDEDDVAVKLDEMEQDEEEVIGEQKRRCIASSSGRPG